MLLLSQQSSVLLSYLEGVTVVAICALAAPEKSPHTPSALLETAVILHGLWNLIVFWWIIQINPIQVFLIQQRFLSGSLYKTALLLKVIFSGFINHVFISFSADMTFHNHLHSLPSMGIIMNSQCDKLPDSMIAQLVEHCTGITKVVDLNSVQAWIFSGNNFTSF